MPFPYSFFHILLPVYYEAFPNPLYNFLHKIQSDIPQILLPVLFLYRKVFHLKAELPSVPKGTVGLTIYVLILS